MTDQQYEVGQEVWVRHYIAGLESSEKHPVYVSALTHPHLDDLRTRADFKDPLDQAIVDRMLTYKRMLDDRNVRADTVDAQLDAALDTVQAKLDSQRPKTAELVIREALDDQPQGGSINALDLVDALRSAGLLKEEAEK